MLLFLYGPDTYRSRQKLDEIVGEYRDDIKKNKVELKKFDGEDLDFPEFKNAIEVLPLFSSKKIIIVKGLSAGPADPLKDRMREFLPILAASQDIIVFLEGEVKKNDKFFNALKEISESQEFNMLGPLELRKWIDNYVKKQDFNFGKSFKLDPRAREALTNFIGPDLWQMKSEIDKLILYKTEAEPAGAGIIALGDVEFLVKSQIKTYIFKTIDAIAAKNKKEALKLLHEHLAKQESEFYIFTMFIWQMRNMVQVKDLEARGLPLPQIIKKTKLSPFVAGKNSSMGRRFTLPEIKSIYRYLLELDLAMKTGRIDPKLALDMFVFKAASGAGWK